MSSRYRKTSPSLGSLALATTLIVITFILIGFVALSVVTGNTFGLGNNSGLDYPAPRQATTSPEAYVVGTPDPSAVIPFQSTALGFGLEYPKGWQKNEHGLRVMFSPSAGGLDPTHLQDKAIWFGIPTDNTTNSADLLVRTQMSLSPNSQLLETKSIIVGEEAWDSAQIRFEDEQLGEMAIAAIAATNKNEVGYYIVAVAPAAEWDSFQPVFQRILDSFHFTTEAVLRPTDATPPPTPTPTPTPVVHVVQSGETLSHIAAQYGVTIEALSLRNDIDDPRRLQTGARLIIPLKRN